MAVIGVVVVVVIIAIVAVVAFVVVELGVVLLGTPGVYKNDFKPHFQAFFKQLARTPEIAPRNWLLGHLGASWTYLGASWPLWEASWDRLGPPKSMACAASGWFQLVPGRGGGYAAAPAELSGRIRIYISFVNPSEKEVRKDMRRKGR